jgi:hypothetical protein
MSDTEFKKHDADKNRMELLPPFSLQAIAGIFTFGAKKYDDFNYMRGAKWSRYYGALQRHLNAWYQGEENDPETGKSHLYHAGCCIMILIETQQFEKGEDDRPKFTNPQTP